MSVSITEETFDYLLATFKRSAFRMEMRDAYALDYEQEEFSRFLAGTPTPPPQLDWWQSWLDQITRLTSDGKTISRVRVLAEPPSDYQRWMIWAAPWYAEAGERIAYMTQRKAYSLGLPEGDWWLLDDERAVIMGFDDEDRLEVKTLITDPELITRYITWRDLAVRNATTAERFAAA